MRLESFSATITVLALALALASPGGGAAPGQGKETVLPSESCRGLWIVPLRVGETTLEMILDTGAEPTSVDPAALSRALGAPVETGKVYTVRDASLGEFIVDRIRIGAYDLDALDRALGRNVDGILGVEPFRDVLLTLDYELGEVRVGKGRLPRPDGRRVFKDTGGIRPMLATEVGGRKEKILIDSGSTGEFDLEGVERLEWVVEPRPVNAAVRFSRVEIDEAGRMAGALKFGSTLFEDPIVERTSGTSLAGYEILRHFVWTFDIGSKRMRIRPIGSGPIRMEGVRGLGVAFEPSEDGFEVVQVFPGAPAAEVGLEEGDLVTHQNGVPVLERDCVGPGDAAEKASVGLTVRRGDTVFSIDVPVATLVP